jgi:hypothetical protein
MTPGQEAMSAASVTLSETLGKMAPTVDMSVRKSHDGAPSWNRKRVAAKNIGGAKPVQGEAPSA